MRYVKLYLGQGFFEILIAAAMPHKPLPRTGRQAKSGSQRSHKEFQFVLIVWSNPFTGTFCASEGEPRISSDISQRTDRYHVFYRIGTWSTQTALEKVHAFPHTRKLLSFPWLRRNLSVSLESVFTWGSSMYISCNGITPWIYSNSKAAAPIHFLHCRLLASFDRT